MHEVRSHHSNGNGTTVAPTVVSDDGKDAQEEQPLFNQVLKLYMRKIDTKL